MWARSWAFLIWASVAALAVFWGLRLFGNPPQAPAHAQPAPMAAVARADLSRVLGTDPAAAPAAPSTTESAVDQGRFQLLGVIAAGAPGASGGPGWATISVDGKPARTYRVGSVIEGHHVLQKVAARGVDIGPRGAAPVVSLKLSALPPAATGRLGGNGAAPGAPVAPGPLPLPGARPGAAFPGPSPAPAMAPPAQTSAAVQAEAAGTDTTQAPVPSSSLRRPGPATR